LSVIADWGSGIADCGLRIADCGLREPLQSLPFLNNAQAARRAQLARNPVFATLVVPGRAEAARQGLLQFYAFQETVE